MMEENPSPRRPRALSATQQKGAPDVAGRPKLEGLSQIFAAYLRV